MRARCRARASRSSSRMRSSIRRFFTSTSIALRMPSEIEELGLDSAADAVLIVEWPERAGEAVWPRRPRPVARVRAERRQNLDSRGPPVMGRTMASRMIPPDHAHDFLASCGWAGARIEPLAGDASFRRYFRVIGEAPPGRADGRPAAARGPKAVRGGRPVADRSWAERAQGARQRPRPRPVAAARFRRRPLSRDGRQGFDPRARAVRACDRRARPSAQSSADAGPAQPRARSMARRARACSPTGIARRSGSRSTWMPIVRPGPRCSSRSRPMASGRSPCCATIMPRTSCWSRAARAFGISACSISRTHLPGHPGL